MIAYAQGGTELARSFVAQINEVILFPLIALLTAVALLVFLWGGFQYVYNAGSEQGRAEGRKHIMWGIIGLLVMLSAYSILTIAANTVGVDVENPDSSAVQFQPNNYGLTPGAYTPNTNGSSDTSNTGGDSSFSSPGGSGGFGSPGGDSGFGSPGGSGGFGSPGGNGTANDGR